MKILISGSTGFVGGHLAQRLVADGHELVRVGRGSSANCDWSEEQLRPAMTGCDAIVHLAGAPIMGPRWTEERKALLISSRTETTALLARLAAELQVPRFVQASAVGYYGPRDEKAVFEDQPPGDDFLARLCVAWEDASKPAEEAGVSVARVRIGVVLGTDGGALKTMLLPFKLGLGGPLGHGRQMLAWVHIDDLVELFVFMLEHPEAQGAFNGCAPAGAPSKVFAKTLGAVLGRPAFLPVPAFVLRILLGEVADMLLTGQRAVPMRTQQAGFLFRYAELQEALGQLLAKG